MAASSVCGDSPDDALPAVVDWAAEEGLTLYPHQDEAVIELLGGNNVILATPTGSGKSLVATGAHFAALAEGRVTFYTAPIKALVSEKFFALCDVRRRERGDADRRRGRSTATPRSSAARPRCSPTSRCARARTPTSARS